MKTLKFILFFFFIISFLTIAKSSAETAFNPDPFRKLCVGIQGKFIARNWKGGDIEVGCAGDSGSYTSNPDQRCVGEVQKIAPGQKFRLTKCSCFGNNNGCLKVGKDLRREPLVNGKRKITVVQRIQDTPAFKNNNCTINNTKNICGSNGERIYKAHVKIKCGPTVTPSPTPPICPAPSKVTNVKVTCTNCPISGAPTPTPTSFLTPTPTPTLTPEQNKAFIESGGSVVMEAENNDMHIRRNGYRWDGACCDTGGAKTSLTGFGGAGFIEARPNDDLNTFLAPSHNKGPEVVYNVKFTTAEAYYVYVRSSGPDGKSDSAHIGLSKIGADPALLGSMALYRIGEDGQTANWTWKSKNNDGTRTTINIPTQGIYRFHIWMREDGTRIDRIRLSTNKDWVASPNEHAQGPNESPKETVQ